MSWFNWLNKKKTSSVIEPALRETCGYIVGVLVGSLPDTQWKVSFQKKDGEKWVHLTTPRNPRTLDAFEWLALLSCGLEKSSSLSNGHSFTYSFELEGVRHVKRTGPVMDVNQTLRRKYINVFLPLLGLGKGCFNSMEPHSTKVCLDGDNYLRNQKMYDTVFELLGYYVPGRDQPLLFRVLCEQLDNVVKSPNETLWTPHGKDGSAVIPYMLPEVYSTLKSLDTAYEYDNVLIERRDKALDATFNIPATYRTPTRSAL